MLKTRLLIIAFVASVLSVFSVGAANAAYAPPPITGDGPSNVEPGAQFQVSFSSTVNCAWTSTFNGENGAPGAGTDYSATFTAPTTDGVYNAIGKCTWDPEVENNQVLAPVSSGNAVTPALSKTRSFVAAPQTDTYTIAIVVGDPSDDGDDDNGNGAGAGSGSDDSDASGILPNTGGESLAYLAVGGALVAAGAAVTVAARRRKTA